MTKIETKLCLRCGETKRTREFHRNRTRCDGLSDWCRSCVSKYDRERRLYDPEHVNKIARESKYRRGVSRPLESVTDCGAYLGIHIAENVLARVFDHVERAPRNNPGFDFRCRRGHLIDVKSATKLKSRRLAAWKFHVGKNTIADYFLLLAFDNRESLNPLHIWLIPGHHVHDHVCIDISESTLSKWSEYELQNKLADVVACCNSLRSSERT